MLIQLDASLLHLRLQLGHLRRRLAEDVHGRSHRLGDIENGEGDVWNDDWVDNMERWGNAKGNAFWEARTPGKRPTSEDSDSQNHVLKSFIRDKYESRRWAADGAPTEWIHGEDGAPPAAAVMRGGSPSN